MSTLRFPAGPTGSAAGGGRSPLALVLGLVFFMTPPAGAQDHPMDPLSWEEHWVVREVLHEAGRIDDDTRLPLVVLDRPVPDRKMGVSGDSGSQLGARRTIPRAGSIPGVWLGTCYHR